MRHAKYIPLLTLCLFLAACGQKPAENPPEASVTEPPAVSEPEPDVSKPDASEPDSSAPVPLTREDLAAAHQAALDYYAGTVFEVTELVFEEQMANTVSYTVKCSKGGVKVDPDRAIVLECTDGVWTVVNEGY